MAAQSNVNLEKCALFKCLCRVWKLNSSALTAGQILALVQSLALKILCKSVKTLHLFVCTHNNNKSLCFCKIMNGNRMGFLPSWSLVNLSVKLETLCIGYLLYRHERYTWYTIFIESEISTFKWLNSNVKQIFSNYIFCIKHPQRRIHYCVDDESVLLTSSLKPKTKKALEYQ